MNILFETIDWILFAIAAFHIAYVLFFALAALTKSEQTQCPTKPFLQRFVFLIPAYKEDRVICDCVASCLAQNYPKEKYEIIVISDQMRKETEGSLEKLPLKLVRVCFENSTKAKALNHAMKEIDDAYDIGIILDADNIIGENFLQEINEAFQKPSVEIVQAHRTAKNINTDLAYLDALSEEINNTIFRLGHARAGLSAALIGSGMAFNYQLLKTELKNIDAIGGFDRALELTLLQKGKRIHYLQHTLVQDEKVQSSSNFSRQRRRWMSAQWHYLKEFIVDFPREIKRGNWDFCDKLLQQAVPPRLLLLGFTFLMACTTLWISIEIAWKWIALLGVLCVALGIAIPKKLFSRKMATSLPTLLYSFFLIVGNLFRLKGANKSFIHTSHGDSV